MKYTEFHRKIKAKGWKLRAGSSTTPKAHTTFTPGTASSRPLSPFMGQKRCPSHYGEA